MALSSNAAAAKVQNASPAGRLDVRSVQDEQQKAAELLKKRSEMTAAQTEKLNKLRTARGEAIAAKDIDTLKILNADFETAALERNANERDIVGMQIKLLDGFKQMGIAIKASQEFNEEENKLISDAAALIDTTKGKVTQAEAMQYNIFGWRDAAIAKAKANVETVEAAAKAAREQAEVMRRERRAKMNLRQAMQLQQAVTQELTDIAQARISTIEETRDAVQANLTLTMDAIKEDTRLLEELDAKMVQANGELNTLNEELASYVPNSSDWQNCRSQILDKTRVRDDIEADRNAALLRAQEGQRFVEFNRGQVQGQIQALAQTKNWIALLQMGMQQRDVLYDSQLELGRSSSELEAMASHDQLAVETDERMVMDAAMMTEAMRKATLDRLARMPGDVQRLRQITEADVKNQVEFEKKFDDMIEKFKQNFDAVKGYDDRGAHRDAPPAA